MRRIVLSIAVLLAAGPMSANAQTLGLDIRFEGYFELDPDSWTLGWSFSVEEPISVNALGAWDQGANGLNFGQMTSLWTADGVLLASVFVDNDATPVQPAFASNNTGQWLLADIPDIVLGVGEYVIGIDRLGGSGDVFQSEDTIIVTDARVTYIESRYSDLNTFGFPMYAWFGTAFFGPTFSIGVDEPEPEAAFALVIDEDGIGKGEAPAYFQDYEVNEGIVGLGQRATLPAFDGAYIGSEITLYTGEVGDEGWFALRKIPKKWGKADPDSSVDTDGLTNYILAGPGLGTGNDPEKYLDKVKGVTSLRATGLEMLVGHSVCAVVQKSDISINYDPLNGSLKGDSRGKVAFRVVSVTPLVGQSSSSLPEVIVEVLDANAVCGGPLSLFEDAPKPNSSAKPFDTGH